MTDGREGRFDHVRRPQMHPVLGREVVEREQCFPVFGKALGGLRIFRLVGQQEGVESVLRLAAGLGHPDRLQAAFGFALHRTRQIVQHIGHLMDPVALLAGFREPVRNFVCEA